MCWGVGGGEERCGKCGEMLERCGKVCCDVEKKKEMRRKVWGYGEGVAKCVGCEGGMGRGVGWVWESVWEKCKCVGVCGK